jgi:hypothetical protein
VWGVQLSCIVKVLQQVARFGKKTKKKKKGYGGDGDDVHLIHEERERKKMVEEVVIFLGDFQSPKT